MKFRYKIAQFLSGRYFAYGIDTLTKVLAGFCITLAVANIVLSLFGLVVVGFILYVIETIVFFWMAFRLFSKNISSRQNENRKFLSLFKPLKDQAELNKRKKNDRNTHIYKKCPHCKVVLRLPKRSGAHTVNCPRCKNNFKVKVK